MTTGSAITSGRNERCSEDPDGTLAFIEYADDNGNHAAFTYVVALYRDQLVRYLRRLVNDRDAAEDVCQETLMHAAAKAHMFDRSRKLKAWLFTVAHNRAIDHNRKAGRRTVLSIDLPAEGADSKGMVQSLSSMLVGFEFDPADAAESSERDQRTFGMLSELSEELRVVVTLAYFHGRKYQEIANELGIPMGTVKSRLHAAIVKLHDVAIERGLGA